jgi:hypothetical protein
MSAQIVIPKRQLETSLGYWLDNNREEIVDRVAELIVSRLFWSMRAHRGFEKKLLRKRQRKSK